MASKIKEGFKELKDNAMNALRGPKYHGNLLGESLYDMMRQATSKALLEPDYDLNQQVVDTIQQEVASGKDSKDIAGCIKKRLKTDHPQKQWLAITLTGKVMQDCGAVIGMHQEELLQEVARVMARPAKPDTEPGRKTRQAAKDLLRTYGRAGTDAFMAVNRYGGRGASGHTAGAGYNGPAAAGVDPALYNGAYGASAGVNGERASTLAEVQMIIDQAKANTELLSDMLLNRQQPGEGGGAGSPSGTDEFEHGLQVELITEVRDLRSLLGAYLEQLQGMEGGDVEVVLMQALEAADMLDNTLALEQEVLSNNVLQSTASPTADPAPAAHPPKAAVTADLISLDELGDALPPSASPAAAAAYGGAATSPPHYNQLPATATHNADPFADPFMSSLPMPPPVLETNVPYPGQGHAAHGNNPMPGAGYGQPYGAAAHMAAQAVPAAYHAMPAAVPQPLPPQVLAAPASNNPFAGSGFATVPPTNPFAVSTASPYGAPQGYGAPPAYLAPSPAPAMPAAAPGGAASVDAEWDMFFANRAGAPAAPPAAAAPAANNLHADFDDLVARR